MTKEQKIDKIYEIIADKSLTFWCNIYCSLCIDWCCWFHFHTIWNEDVDVINQTIRIGDYYHIQKIIWHNILIGDVLNWLDKSKYTDLTKSYKYYGHYFDIVDVICDLRTEKLLCFENQSEKCIDYIYNLITQNEW